MACAGDGDRLRGDRRLPPRARHRLGAGRGHGRRDRRQPERYYGAIFLGYGLAWIWAARQSPISSRAVRWLAGIFLLGGVGRILSMALHGRPQWFQVALTVIELAVPPLYFWLSTADEKAAATRLREAGEGSRNRVGL